MFVNQRLPFLLRAFTLILLCGVFMGTASWIWWLDQRSHRGGPGTRHEFVARDTGFYYAPLPILYLGARFLWHFRHEKGAALTVFYWYVALLLVPLLVVVCLGGVPRPPNREASGGVMDELP